MLSKELIDQLEAEGKELIAITDQYILVYWWQDNSYVSWNYWYTGTQYAFEIGHYLPIGSGVTKNEAIKWFAERINNV